MQISRPRAFVLAVTLALTTACTFDAGPSQAEDPRPLAAFDDRAEPPAKICGSPKLEGPATAPPGAIQVRPGRHLGAVAERAPEGATIWLAPGLHTFGDGEYDQAMPRDRQQFIGAPGAVLDGRNLNRYAFTGHATGVRISHLTIQNFGKVTDNNNEGVVNHDAGNGWRMTWNTVRRNGGAGVFLGDRNRLRHNCLERNGQYGFSAYQPNGVRDLKIEHNEIAFNNTADWEERSPGCGCTGGGKFWDVNGAVVADNWVHDNMSVGLWADTNNRGFSVRGNYIADNDAEGIVYEISYNAEFVDNTFVRNGLEKGPTNPGFPTPAIYISESGSDPRVKTPFGRRMRIARNTFTNNWSGIVGWENADRFAGSPANTSSGYGTLVNPDATLRTCRDPDKISHQPYLGDCRWRTQRLRVVGNTFTFDPAVLGPRCTADNGCGFMALFSNWGSYPDWSPYQGTWVADRIATRQHNLWNANRYSGPWRFMAGLQGDVVGWRAWRNRFDMDLDSQHD